jgi:S-adenosylmethionine:tRNA ribosyltransferase-isomerase
VEFCVRFGLGRAWAWRNTGRCARESPGWGEGIVLRTSDLDYELPPERIATHPVVPRDAARLLVVDRRGGGTQHRWVKELPGLLRPRDLLVFNTTRVLPARFRGVRQGTGGKVEGLYLREAQGSVAGALVWTALIKGRHTRAGAVLELDDPAGKASGVRLRVTGRPDGEPEAWTVAVEGDNAAGVDTPRLLERVGLTPLPPYILKARRAAGDAGDEDVDRGVYQTVYAREAGSVAAPTAGLHFTPELLGTLGRACVEMVDVVLHVGTGTFRPVETEFVEQHPMHTEWCSMIDGAIRAVRETRAHGGRVIAVGTTAARTLETYAHAVGDAPGVSIPDSINTAILITPGYKWRWVDGLLTNFHLPRSTLMALVAALLPDGAGAGVERLKAVYAEAIAEGYRFYSFGDAMLVL